MGPWQGIVPTSLGGPKRQPEDVSVGAKGDLWGRREEETGPGGVASTTLGPRHPRPITVSLSKKGFPIRTVERGGRAGKKGAKYQSSKVGNRGSQTI